VSQKETENLRKYEKIFSKNTNDNPESTTFILNTMPLQSILRSKFLKDNGGEEGEKGSFEER
jgi:hypothetical protein